MGVPLSIRLDDDVRKELEVLARARGVGLSTYVRDLATEAARDAWKRRIREASAEIGRLIETSPEARSFYEDWSTPTADVG